VPDRHIVQERIDGTPASVSFVADGRRALVLGVARGLAGEEAFGASGYRYCGSLFPFAVPARTLDRLDAIVQSATRAFGLVGVNGIDFVLREDEPFVLELNPRYSASMELIQRAGVEDLFALHAAACRGSLPPLAPRVRAGVWGKAVLWARHDVVAPCTRAWLQRDDVRDVPFPEERIRRRSPVCTVLSQGRDPRACFAALVETARAVERALVPFREPVGARSAVRR
jgi:predicted ATP-grasp superfamily ATP-dependent carboligase